MRKLFPFVLLAALACSCGNERQIGTPNDPNEQQGNPQAQPEKSVKNKSNSEPSDNAAGRNAHTNLPNGDNNQ